MFSRFLITYINISSQCFLIGKVPGHDSSKKDYFCARYYILFCETNLEG